MTKEKKENLCFGWLLVSIVIFLIGLMFVSSIPLDKRDGLLYFLLFTELNCIGSIYCIWRLNRKKAKGNE
jgi:hypothetical protein